MMEQDIFTKFTLDSSFDLLGEPYVDSVSSNEALSSPELADCQNDQVMSVSDLDWACLQDYDLSCLDATLLKCDQFSPDYQSSSNISDYTTSPPPLFDFNAIINNHQAIEPKIAKTQSGIKKQTQIILNFEDDTFAKALDASKWDLNDPSNIETSIDINSDSDLDSDSNDAPIDQMTKILTNEEKDLFIKEGYTLPTHLPLTKSELKVLRLVKRKIRNKKSANLSRERKKTYVNGLEKRIDTCTKENEKLHKTIKGLKSQNMQLFTKMKEMQVHLNTLLSKHKKTSTAVLFISFFVTFYAYPYLELSDTTSPVVHAATSYNPPHYSRTLLSYNIEDGTPNDDAITSNIIKYDIADETWKDYIDKLIK